MFSSGTHVELENHTLLLAQGHVKINPSDISRKGPVTRESHYLIHHKAHKKLIGQVSFPSLQLELRRGKEGGTNGTSRVGGIIVMRASVHPAERPKRISAIVYEEGCF